MIKRNVTIPGLPRSCDHRSSNKRFPEKSAENGIDPDPDPDPDPEMGTVPRDVNRLNSPRCLRFKGTDRMPLSAINLAG